MLKIAKTELENTFFEPDSLPNFDRVELTYDADTSDNARDMSSFIVNDLWRIRNADEVYLRLILTASSTSNKSTKEGLILYIAKIEKVNNKEFATDVAKITGFTVGYNGSGSTDLRVFLENKSKLHLNDVFERYIKDADEPLTLIATLEASDFDNEMQ
ncbi:hypothetical protein LNP18_06530 [Leuconostoc citreum]|uniref:hypothetical protein n=1 Tax=Leuconostoc citreum TaxID=33964 RepID=UPI00200B5FD5|nr:hypothetical protein [Leuconostoc citreum]MCK8605760.1 hypothetical protein [Leuconostoc citreum]